MIWRNRVRSIPPVESSTSRPKADTISRCAGSPGAASVRAISSVSMTGTPWRANSIATVDFPLPMPPVNPTRRGEAELIVFRRKAPLSGLAKDDKPRGASEAGKRRAAAR